MAYGNISTDSVEGTGNMLRDYIYDVAHAISNHGNAAIGKSMQYFGIATSSVGIGTYATKGHEVVQAGMTWSDWGGIVGVVGGITLIIKTGVDIYFNIRKDRREAEAHKREQEQEHNE